MRLTATIFERRGCPRRIGDTRRQVLIVALQDEVQRQRRHDRPIVVGSASHKGRRSARGSLNACDQIRRDASRGRAAGQSMRFESSASDKRGWRPDAVRRVYRRTTAQFSLWHSSKDEFIYVLESSVTLFEGDAKAVLAPERARRRAGASARRLASAAAGLVAQLIQSRWPSKPETPLKAHRPRRR